MKSVSTGCLTAGISTCLALASCGPPTFHIPPPVPPPIGEHIVAAPPAQSWQAALRALAALGFTGAESNREQGTIVTAYRASRGNGERRRNSAIARFAIERDIYSAGRERLLVHLTAAGARQTQVTVTAAIEAKVARHGEIAYGKASQGNPPAPTEPGRDWEPLTSNGVLEDEFLAALAAELSRSSAPEQ